MLIAIKRQPQGGRGWEKWNLIKSAWPTKRISITGRQLANKQIAKNNSRHWEKFQQRNKPSRVEILMKWNVVCQMPSSPDDNIRKATRKGRGKEGGTSGTACLRSIFALWGVASWELILTVFELGEDGTKDGLRGPHPLSSVWYFLRRFVHYWLGTGYWLPVHNQTHGVLGKYLGSNCNQFLVKFLIPFCI